MDKFRLKPSKLQQVVMNYFYIFCCDQKKFVLTKILVP